MRKDVRMGFAVGGVLLAVLVVAILVFHHNKNADKTVAFDSGGKGSVAPANDLTTPDSAPRPDGTPPGDSGPSAPAPAPADGSSESKPPADDSTQKGGAQWDALFASTSADPLKAQLTSDGTGKSGNKAKKLKTGGSSTANRTDKVESAGAPAVSNAPLVSQGSALSVPFRAGAAERSTTSGQKDSTRTHVVAQGETFVSIARAVYGDGRYYQSLVDANPNVVPEKLRPGMTISLPPDSQVKNAHKSSKPASTSASASSSGAEGRTYTVQKDDNLYKIARKLYGSGEKGTELYEANKQVIGPDSTRLKIGMVLTLPEAPTDR
jgi:nucleoid-associated protein YgaU